MYWIFRLQISIDIDMTISFIMCIFSEHLFNPKAFLCLYSFLAMSVLVPLEFGIYYYMPINYSYLDISIFCSVIKNISSLSFILSTLAT